MNELVNRRRNVVERFFSWMDKNRRLRSEAVQAPEEMSPEEESSESPEEESPEDGSSEGGGVGGGGEGGGGGGEESSLWQPPAQFESYPSSHLPNPAAKKWVQCSVSIKTGT